MRFSSKAALAVLAVQTTSSSAPVFADSAPPGDPRRTQYSELNTVDSTTVFRSGSGSRSSRGIPRPLYLFRDIVRPKVRPLWEGTADIVETKDNGDAVECDPDVGILSCGVGYSCEPDQGSTKGGFCRLGGSGGHSSSSTLRRLQIGDVTCPPLDAVADELTCDCANFNTTTADGSFSCMDDGYCYTQNPAVCGTLSYMVQVDPASKILAVETCFSTVLGGQNKSFCYGIGYSLATGVSCDVSANDCPCSCDFVACEGANTTSQTGALISCVNGTEPINFCTDNAVKVLTFSGQMDENCEADVMPTAPSVFAPSAFSPNAPTDDKMTNAPLAPAPPVQAPTTTNTESPVAPPSSSGSILFVGGVLAAAVVAGWEATLAFG